MLINIRPADESIYMLKKWAKIHFAPILVYRLCSTVERAKFDQEMGKIFCPINTLYILLNRWWG